MDAVLIFFILVFFNQIFLRIFKKKYPYINIRFLNILFYYHILFFLAYYTYALFRPSDSKHYYFVSVTQQDHWKNFFNTGTDFISFFAIPFVKLNFSYEALMLTFAWLGYWGFVYAYLLFKENIKAPVKIFGMDFLTMLMFLPNMHFWTASLGKGAVIFLGLMMMTFAIVKPKKRFLTLLTGSFLVYMVRPHVMLFVMTGITIGYLTGKEKIKLSTKIFIILLMIGFITLAGNKILQIVNLENSENLAQDFLEYSEIQSQRLSESSGSGVDMNNYSLPFKFFTFWFRPLFIDAPNALGLVTSFENLLYLFIFSKVINRSFFKFLRNSPRMVKMSFVTFFLATFALTFLMSNLGIIMRQKSQVMYFAFFVIYYYLGIKQQARRKYLQQKKSLTS